MTFQEKLKFKINFAISDVKKTIDFYKGQKSEISEPEIERLRHQLYAYNDVLKMMDEIDKDKEIETVTHQFFDDMSEKLNKLSELINNNK